jgi:hypothetical protein
MDEMIPGISRSSCSESLSDAFLEVQVDSPSETLTEMMEYYRHPKHAFLANSKIELLMMRGETDEWVGPYIQIFEHQQGVETGRSWCPEKPWKALLGSVDGGEAMMSRRHWIFSSLDYPFW